MLKEHQLANIKEIENYSAVELGTTALKELLNQLISIQLLLNKLFSEMSLQSGIGQNSARQIAIKSGIPDTTPAMTINEVCGSGLKAIILGSNLFS